MFGLFSIGLGVLATPNSYQINTLQIDNDILDKEHTHTHTPTQMMWVWSKLQLNSEYLITFSFVSKIPIYSRDLIAWTIEITKNVNVC